MYDLEERMKMYERGYTPQRMMPNLPALVRLDGRAFHSFTRQCIKPFDKDLHGIFVYCLQDLMNETNAYAGYTQSDEITLLLYAEDYRSQLYFDGKRDKINSVLASLTTISFRERALQLMIECKEDLGSPFRLIGEHHALFDCRTWNVPNKAEACNVFIWREQDAARNSIQMLAQHELGHSRCHNKSCNELQEIVFQEKGINWNDLPAEQKNGTFILRKQVDGRRKFVTAYLPRLTTIANLEDVLFYGQDFQLKVIQ